MKTAISMPVAKMRSVCARKVIQEMELVVVSSFFQLLLMFTVTKYLTAPVMISKNNVTLTWLSILPYTVNTLSAMAFLKSID